MTTANLPSPTRPSLRMSEEEYAKWGLIHEHCEWVNGEVILKMSASKDHDEIQSLIRGVVEHFVKRRRLGKVAGPSFTTRMKLIAKTVRRDPDVMFIAAANLDRLHKNHLEGAADLVVEVVSPESDFRDFNEKYREYEEGGVREYWIINPLGETAHVFTRNVAGEFEACVAADDGRFHSSVIDGLWFHPADLFAADRPDVFTLIKQIDPTLLT